MTPENDFFRDYGILPHGEVEPPQMVRCYLPWGDVIGQYVSTGVLSALVIYIALILVVELPLPFNLLTASAPLVVAGYGIYAWARNQYFSVELCGRTLRARHLYTWREIERSVQDIEELTTLLYPVVNAFDEIGNVMEGVTQLFLGRVRGVAIHFRDKRDPVVEISRARPAMRNAKELIEAVLYRMEEVGAVDAEIILLDGKPLVQRIYWKGQSLTNRPGK
jgi:hypothetical protein